MLRVVGPPEHFVIIKELDSCHSAYLFTSFQIPPSGTNISTTNYYENAGGFLSTKYANNSTERKWPVYMLSVGHVSTRKQ